MQPLLPAGNMDIFSDGRGPWIYGPHAAAVMVILDHSILTAASSKSPETDKHTVWVPEA